jgi:hypothetical protein
MEMTQRRATIIITISITIKMLSISTTTTKKLALIMHLLQKKAL